MDLIITEQHKLVMVLVLTITLVPTLINVIRLCQERWDCDAWIAEPIREGDKDNGSYYSNRNILSFGD